MIRRFEMGEPDQSGQTYDVGLDLYMSAEEIESLARWLNRKGWHDVAGEIEDCLAREAQGKTT